MSSRTDTSPRPALVQAAPPRPRLVRYAAGLGTCAERGRCRDCGAIKEIYTAVVGVGGRSPALLCAGCNGPKT